MLQLLKATLQASELLSDRTKGLNSVVHELLLLAAPGEGGGPPAVSLLERLIRTLCGNTPTSADVLKKTAFVLRMCTARHEDWELTKEMFQQQELLQRMTDVLSSALAEQIAAGNARRAQAKSQQRWKAEHAQQLPTESAELPCTTNSGNSGAESSAREQDDVCQVSKKMYNNSVADGMRAERGPAVAVRHLFY